MHGVWLMAPVAAERGMSTVLSWRLAGMVRSACERNAQGSTCERHMAGTGA